jgi:hypothetical protein
MLSFSHGLLMHERDELRRLDKAYLAVENLLKIDLTRHPNDSKDNRLILRY